MLKIHDLVENETLDREAMRHLKAGYSLKTSDGGKIQNAAKLYQAWYEQMILNIM